jgi:hypothetical protein
MSPWIIGADPDGEREYIVHTAYPRFIARIYLDEDELMVCDDDRGGNAGQSLDIVNQDGDAATICVLRWDDPPPADERIDALLRDAAAAMAIADDASDQAAYELSLQPMEAVELRACGELIFGANWQTPLARRLGVEPRTVRHWLSGRNAIAPERAFVIRGWAMKATPDT